MHERQRILAQLGIGIYTTFLNNKNNGLQQHQAPSPAGEGWGDDCMDAGGRAMQEQLPRRFKSSSYIPPHPNLLPLEKEQ